jgi:hypothetical protein
MMMYLNRYASAESARAASAQAGRAEYARAPAGRVSLRAGAFACTSADRHARCGGLAEQPLPPSACQPAASRSGVSAGRALAEGTHRTWSIRVCHVSRVRARAALPLSFSFLALCTAVPTLRVPYAALIHSDFVTFQTESNVTARSLSLP